MCCMCYCTVCAGCDAALVVDRPPVPCSVADCASKAAMGGLLHALVCDLSQHNIQVSYVCVGLAFSFECAVAPGSFARGR